MAKTRDDIKNGLISCYYIDSNENPVTEKKKEVHKINSLKNIVQLLELPERGNKVRILNKTGMVEVKRLADLKEENQYWVDYESGTGNIFFHPNKQAQTVEVEYDSKGYTIISADRVFTDFDEEGSLPTILGELLRQNKAILEEIFILGGGIQVFYKLQQAIADGTELHTNLQTDISTGTPLNESLKIEVPKAQAIEPKLKEQNVEANRILPLLTAQNEQAVINHSNLQEDIANTSEIIDKINAIGKDSITITPSMWSALADEEGNYNYVWNHNLNTKNIILQCYIVNEDGSEESALTPYSIIDSNNIKIFNDDNTQTLKMSKV